MAMTLSEFQKAFDEDPASLFKNTPCCKCQKPLQGAITGRRRIAEGDVCDDCYFDLLGAEIEAHPIFTPRAPRGC